MFVAFVVVDVLVRVGQRRIEEARERREREAALQTSLRLDFTHEAKSLKRVEVNDAKARILAVDDEPVVLDSFRKILVLAGFSVDTVENGPEALGLVQRRDYDFVFTDLKMPGMDGVEVVKAVRHLRPDVDVAVITGYGTIETAVETMQHGAVDYVQKPFTEDELLEFAKQAADQAPGAPRGPARAERADRGAERRRDGGRPRLLRSRRRLRLGGPHLGAHRAERAAPRRPRRLRPQGARAGRGRRAAAAGPGGPPRRAAVRRRARPAEGALRRPDERHRGPGQRGARLRAGRC